jgi:transposase InsO family protein
MPAFPEVPWERYRIWMWDATHFTSAGRVAYAIVDVVTRYWIGYLLSIEQTHTQAQLLFARALEDQGLDELAEAAGQGPDAGPILVAWSDNGAEMTASDTRAFMALMAIAQHHGRPSTPTDQAHIESFFSHLKGDWPHLAGLRDPAALDTELARIQVEYNTVRLHAAIGYVTPRRRASRPRARDPPRSDRRHEASARRTPPAQPQEPRAMTARHILLRDGGCLREGVGKRRDKPAWRRR